MRAAVVREGAREQQFMAFLLPFVLTSYRVAKGLRLGL
jgi:hypothetical protein